MSYFIKSGNTFRVADENSVDIRDRLPPGNYIIKEDMFKNLFLEMVDTFEQRGKIYGDTPRYVDRIMNTFMDRSSSTGVMLNGEKGSGKTLLARLLAMRGIEMDMPTIIVNNPWYGDAFNKLIQDIDQPAIVLFDEFEKVYDREGQESILTLLDGVFPTKKLFVITCNDKWRVDQHMRNRPGRIYYMLDFKGLDAMFIADYCGDNLKNKSYIDTICKISTLFSEFNFDMLKALVEEMNRYDESPQVALKMLNAKPEYGDSVVYNVKAIVGNKPMEPENIEPSRWKGNPLNGQFDIDVWQKKGKGDDGDWRTLSFNQNDLLKVDSNQGEFVFANDKGTVILTRERDKVVNYYGAL